MKKFLSVLSGIYLILIGILVLVIFIIGYFTSAREFSMQLGQLKVFKPIFDITSIAFLLWPIITGIGVILKKNWARFSVFIMSVFAIFVGIFTFLVFLAIPSSQDVKVNYQGIKLILLGLNFLFLTVIPVFFIIFFNSKSTKELFMLREEARVKGGRPFGVTLIALLSLLGCLFYIIFVIQNSDIKILLTGYIMLSGKALKAFCLIETLIYLYVGIGLLKMKRIAWFTAILLNVYHFLLGILNIFTISEAALSEMRASFGISNLHMSLKDYKISLAFGLIGSLAILAYLISKKNLFPRVAQSKEVI